MPSRSTLSRSETHGYDRSQYWLVYDSPVTEADEPLGELTELQRFIATRMLRREGEGRHERIGKVTLRLLTGPQADLVVAFTGDRVEGGRGPANDLVLDDSAVSQSHFELVLGRETICLRDLGSTNGTWLGSARIGEIWIPEKAIFTVGATDIEIMSTRRMRVPASRVDQFGPLRGKSTAMRELFVLLERFAATELDVLLEGEIGTGKRLAAETLHHMSKRSSEPVVFYDCGEDEDLAHVEELLLGSVLGGTVVLRRIEELPIHLQPRLLDTLLAEARTTRFLFLSTLDLRTLVSEGLFDEALHKRLAEASVRIPPLRERHGDAVFLAEHFLVDSSPDHIVELAPDAVRGLSIYPFPGNVRELNIAVVRALEGDHKPHITRRDLLLGSTHDPESSDSLSRLSFREAKERFSRGYFTRVATRVDGDVAEIARQAGVSGSTIRRALPWLFR